jgi:hypothetical protein
MTFGPIITFSYLAAHAAVHEPSSDLLAADRP